MNMHEDVTFPRLVDARKISGRSAPSTTAQSLSPTDGRVALQVEGAVKRLYLSPGAAAPRVALFAGLDSDRGVGRACAYVSNLLASSVPASVCLVDANLRTPFLNEMLCAPREEGLVDLLKNPGLELWSVAAKHPDGELWLVTAGTPSARGGDLVDSKVMCDRVAELRAEFDYVVIGASHRDALRLGRMADGVVLVLGIRSTPRDLACRIRSDFDEAGVNVSGVILMDHAPKRLLPRRAKSAGQ